MKVETGGAPVLQSLVTIGLLFVLVPGTPSAGIETATSFWARGESVTPQLEESELADGCRAGFAQMSSTLIFDYVRIRGDHPNRIADCMGHEYIPWSGHHFPTDYYFVYFREHCPSGFGGGVQPVPTQCARMVIKVVDRYLDQPKEPPSCPASPKSPGEGNPIFPLTGAKRQSVDLGIRIGGKAVTLTYDTRVKLPGAPNTSQWRVPAAASFGPLWQTSLHKSALLQAPNDAIGSAYSNLVLNRGDNVVQTAGVGGFESCSGGGGGGGNTYLSAVDPNLRVIYTGSTGRLVDSRELLQEDYDVSGAVLGVTRASGSSLSYTYSNTETSPAVAPIPGLLVQVTDNFGRYVRFTYEASVQTDALPRVSTVSTSTGDTIRAAYDAKDNLVSLSWPDGRVRQFLYERSDVAWALTGIVDENTVRHATYTYDGVGRATSTELAGGVDRYAVQYTGGAPSWSVSQQNFSNQYNYTYMTCREHRWQAPSGTVLTLPNGQTNALNASTQQGMVALTAQSQPAGSGCAASSTSQSYDAKGNVAGYTDTNGNRSCFAYDTERNLRTVTLSGLASGTSCPANLLGHVPSGANANRPIRTVSTQWHPDWALQVKQAEPGRITTTVYNGQPDPFNGNAVASCAPANAQLPDGKPIAVICKRVEQATTDTNGAQGFSAQLQAGVPNRVTSWTYNQHGQVLTERDPLNRQTSYAYYADTAFSGSDPYAVGHTMGDLQSITNAKGQVTQYTQYDKHGNVLQSVDPNGVVTQNTYDLRQRLLSSTTAGQTTSYQYDAAGQLKRITLPDQSWVGYDYDGAHRQTAVYDHKGNRVDYTLDNAGNRIGEQTKDPSGALKRQLSRSIDALGRVQQTTGRE
jgi:YD repeat-containing protein